MRNLVPWSPLALLVVALSAFAALPAVAGQAAAGKTAPARTPAARVNLNTASASALAALPEVGPATAQKIIAGRPYASVAALAKAGVPQRTIERITSLVTVGAVPRAPASTSAPATAGKTAATKPGGVPGKVQGSFSTLCSGIGC